jgi:hypothetical protein
MINALRLLQLGGPRTWDESKHKKVNSSSSSSSGIGENVAAAAAAATMAAPDATATAVNWAKHLLFFRPLSCPVGRAGDVWLWLLLGCVL